MVKSKKTYLIVNKNHQHHVITSEEQPTTPPLYTHDVQNHDWSKTQAVLMIKDTDWLMCMSNQMLKNTAADVVKSAPTTPDTDGFPLTGAAAAYQWKVRTKDSEGFRHIKASNGHYLYMTPSSGLKTSKSDPGDRALWKFVRLPSLRDLEADNEKQDGKPASDWKGIADYIFQEGLNFIGGTPVASISTPGLRQSWVDTWKKMGRDRGVYPHPQSRF